MNRRSFIKKIGTGGVGAAFWAGTPWPVLADNGYKKLTILHTNDTHSRIEPFPEGIPEFAGQGGVSRRSALINKIRKENPNNLLLDAGDVFEGTPYFKKFDGALDFEIMSHMKYDAGTIGNHEFDNGVQGFVDVADNADFPFVSANYDFGSTPMSYWVREFITRNIDGIRCGIFGLGVDFKNLVEPHLHRGITYKDPVEVSKDLADRLKNYFRCDFIICLSHLGYQYNSEKVSDRILASEVPGIDLIIGGHTHTFLDQPEEFVHEDGQKTLVTQVGHSGLVLGHLDFFFDHNKQVVAVKSNNMSVGPADLSFTG